MERIRQLLDPTYLAARATRTLADLRATRGVIDALDREIAERQVAGTP